MLEPRLANALEDGFSRKEDRPHDLGVTFAWFAVASTARHGGKS